MSWLAKLFGAGKDSDPHAPLVPSGSALRRLIEADMALALPTSAEGQRHLVRFILTGEGEATLDDVAKQIDRTFGRLCVRTTDISTPAPAHARRLFLYRSAGRDLALTLRYLRVLHLAIHGGGYRGDRGDQICRQPEVQQILDIALKHATVTDKIIPDEPLPPDGMTRATLLAIAREEGGDEDDLLTVLLLNAHSMICPTEAWPLAVRLAAASGLAADLAERPAAVRAILDTLPYRGTSLLRVLTPLGLQGQPDYAAYIADKLAAPDRTLRKIVASDFRTLPREIREKLLIERLSSTDARMREEVVTWLTGDGSPAAEAALKARLEVERSSAVRRLIETHIAGHAMLQAAPDPDDETGYTAIGGERIAIPPIQDFVPGTRPVFGEVERQELLALIQTDNAKRRAGYEERLLANAKWNTEPKMIDPVYADYLINTLNGASARAQLPYNSEFFRLLDGAAAAWYRRQLRRLPQETALRECDEGTLSWLSTTGVRTTPLADYLQAPNLDLRQIDRLVTEKKAFNPKGALLAKLIGSRSNYFKKDQSRDYPPEAVWPLVAANLHVFDDAFSSAPKTFRDLWRKSAITWLGLLPATPQRYMAPLLEIATSTKRESRAEARQLLAKAPGLDAHLIGLLQDSKADIRRVAAEWLAERRTPEAEPALRAQLKKEKSEAVRAAMITALDRIGADIAAFAGPAALLAEADAGMAGVAPADAVPAWLPLETLGQLRWRDGQAVPDTVLHWWVRVAIRLKQPGGNGMFALYLNQLHPEDSAALGRLVLDAWLAECLQTKVTEDQWLGRRVSLENEAAETKGLLALARGVAPSHAAAKVRWFLKSHGQQSSQACALLELLAAKSDPQSLQVVLAAANRQKQKSVQKLAGELVERIAEDNDWTLDQLADRTVPDLGLDDTGQMELPCGEDRRLYLARLDETLELKLFNPDGKPVKALPMAEDDATTDSKASFVDAKKALIQVVSIQRERLYDAMCSGRVWPAGDWLSDIHGHPVLRKIAEQLVWLGLDGEGAVIAAFRPTPEGDFIDAAEATVDPGSFAGVRLAHTMLVGARADADWLAHLADHEVDPLFAQFGRSAPGAVVAESDAVSDRLGWVTDTFTLRGLAKKLGYDRGVPGDSGHFDHYLRRFPVAGLLAMITFSGNCLPEENLPAVIHELRFARDLDGKPGGTVAPARVPPVLLAECWHDYHAAAAKAAFDPDWEQRSPW